MNIFVYGTLKKGHHNHKRFLNVEPKFRGIVKGALYSSGLPYLRPGNYDVHGEVYELDEDKVKMLDALEGHPTWYRRTPIVVKTYENEAVFAEAYVYQNVLDEKFLVKSGVYR